MVEQLGIEVVPQTLSGIGVLANRRQTVLVDLRRNRSTSPGQLGAEVVEEAEADLTQGVLAPIEGSGWHVARTRASPGAHGSAAG